MVEFQIRGFSHLNSPLATESKRSSQWSISIGQFLNVSQIFNRVAYVTRIDDHDGSPTVAPILSTALHEIREPFSRWNTSS